MWMPKHCGYLYIHAATYICSKRVIFKILSESQGLLRRQHVILSILPRNGNCREDKLGAVYVSRFIWHDFVTWGLLFNYMSWLMLLVNLHMQSKALCRIINCFFVHLCVVSRLQHGQRAVFGGGPTPCPDLPVNARADFPHCGVWTLPQRRKAKADPALARSSH